jgi:pimeloyl-ACP methyl ester carboxylesterase
VRPTLGHLRRRGSGAVLAFIGLVSLACGGDHGDLAGPPPPTDEGIAPTAGCTDGVLEHGALYRICYPQTWNGDLALYAHGYVPATRDIALPGDLIGGQSISGTLTALGYAFGTTSYRANGLVAPEATEDLVELEARIRRLYSPDPGRTVIIGFSEGGLVATLAVERFPELFDGALAGCGPVGDFQAQLNYIGDFRVIFDYLFPGVIPGTAVDVPETVRSRWEQLYVPAVVAALGANFDAALELIRITGAPVAGSDVRSVAETTVGVLWYDIFGMADARVRLGGQPYDNSSRTYTGSSNDPALNAGVQRYTADPAAAPALARFHTSGDLQVPLSILHTAGDEIVPFSQVGWYSEKVNRAGRAGSLIQTGIDRYGHCAFRGDEVLSAFTSLLEKVKRPAATVALAPAGR